MEKTISDRIKLRFDEIKKLIFEDDAPAEPAKVEAAKAVLVDGTELTVTPAIEVGATATLLDSAGAEIAAPDGDHELQDGTIIVIAGGVITDVKAIEEAAKVDPPAPAALSKAEAEAITAAAIAPLKAEIAKVIEVNKAMFALVEAMSEQPKVEPTEKTKHNFKSDFVSFKDQAEEINRKLYNK